MKGLSYRQMSALLMLVAVAILADQAVKLWVEATLPFHELVPVIPFWALYRTYNDGVAFSMLSAFNGIPLILMTLVIIGLVAILWWRAEKDRLLSHVGYALIIGGALGNLIDRVRLGYVIDYVLFYTNTWSFAVFNLADSFISIGAAAIILSEAIQIWRERDTQKQS